MQVIPYSRHKTIEFEAAVFKRLHELLLPTIHEKSTDLYLKLEKPVGINLLNAITLTIGRKGIPNIDNILKKCKNKDVDIKIEDFLQKIRDTLLSNTPLGLVEYITIEFSEI